MYNFLKDRQSKIIAAIILVIIVAIGYFIVAIQIQHQNKTGVADLKNKCGADAQKFVNNIQSVATNIKYHYTYHYSLNLNKCYVLIHGFGITGTGTSDKLVDIYGNKNIADCESYNMAVELNYCIYNGSKSMYNIDNFNDYVSSYMSAK